MAVSGAALIWHINPDFRTLTLSKALTEIRQWALGLFGKTIPIPNARSEVKDELAEAVKASLETPPKVMDESAAPTGSEVLREAAPQAPSLESVLSSDRPFSPTSMEVTDTRPAVPPSLGMGGERPATLTDSTQTAINQQQALIDAMSPEFDTFGGDALARAEQISNLSGPSISEVSPTVDLDLTTQPDLSEMEKARLATQFTQQQELARAIRNQQAQPQAQPYEGGQYENRDAIESFNKRTFGKPMTPADKAFFLFTNPILTESISIKNKFQFHESIILDRFLLISVDKPV